MRMLLQWIDEVMISQYRCGLCEKFFGCYREMEFFLEMEKERRIKRLEGDLYLLPTLFFIFIFIFFSSRDNMED